LAEYVKILVNHFYSIIVRNLREYIPKSTGHYFIKSLKEDLRFYLLTEATRDFAFEDYLEEDKEVATKRNYYIGLMKVLKNCEKIILHDEEYLFNNIN
jgi:hypothetical protein